MAATKYRLTLEIFDEDPIKSTAKTVEVAPAALQEQIIGWTFDYDFVTGLEAKVNLDMETTPEAVESTILRLFDLEPRIPEDVTETDEELG